MIVSHEARFIVLANPRCGSTTVQTAVRASAPAAMDLRFYTDRWADLPGGLNDPRYNHARASVVKEWIESTGRRWSDYQVLTTIRHPVDRMLSWHRWWHQRNAEQRGRLSRWLGGSPTVMGFEEWFDEVIVRGIERGKVADPRWSAFGCAADGRQLVDEVVRVEDFCSELAPALRRLGVPVEGDLPHKNRSRGRTPELRQSVLRRIEEMFESDFAFY